MTDQVPEQPPAREHALFDGKRPKIIPHQESWLVSTLKLSSLSVSRCNLNLLYEMPSPSSDLTARQPHARGWLG
jgi:hypothetical protein